MRPFLVPMEVETDLKYSKINNVFRLVKRQGLRAGLYPISYRIAWTMLVFRNSSTVSFFFAAWELPSLHKRSRVRSSPLAAVLYENGLYFYKSILQCLMTLKRKGKAAAKIGMQCGILTTDSRFYKPPKWKRKISFRAIASAVRESAVCLHCSFAT